MSTLRRFFASALLGLGLLAGAGATAAPAAAETTAAMETIWILIEWPDGTITICPFEV